jgi:hypothetical protein
MRFLGRRGMRGEMADAAVSPVAKILLMLISTVVIVGLLITILGGVGGIIDAACKAVPGLCKSADKNMPNYITAQTSTLALQHATNCLVAGGDSCLSKEFTSEDIPGQEGGSLMPTFHAVSADGSAASGSESNNVKVTCTGDGDRGVLCECEYLAIDAGKTTKYTKTYSTMTGTTEKFNAECMKKAETDNSKYTSTADPKRSQWYNTVKEKCTPDVVIKLKTVDKCTVENFQLPQQVSNWQEYILNYGDPEFLVYWNKFPIEENTWTFKVDWKVYVAIAALSIVPPTKAAGLTFKGIWYGLKEDTSRTLIKTAFKDAGVSAGAEFVEKTYATSLKELTEKYGEKQAKVLFRSLTYSHLSDVAAKQGGKKWMIKEIMKNNLKDIIVKRLTTKAGLVSTAKRATALTLAAFAIQLADSMSENYVPHGNSLVLKSPFNDSKLYDMNRAWDGKPVLVVWEPNDGFLVGKDKYETAHLVSPCYLDSFEMKKDDVVCSVYSYNKNEQIEECSSPKHVEESDFEDYKTCGTIDEGIDKYLKMEGDKSIYGRLNTILGAQSKRKLFEYSKEGKLSKMYIPWLSSQSQSVYVDSFVLTEHQQIDGIDTPFDILEGNVNYGNKKMTLVTLDSINTGIIHGDSVVMESGKKYIVRPYRCEKGSGIDDDDMVVDIYPYDCDDKDIYLTNKCGKKMLTCEEARSQATGSLLTTEGLRDVFNAIKDSYEIPLNGKPVAFTASKDVTARELLIDGMEFGHSTLSYESYYQNDGSAFDKSRSYDCGIGGKDVQCFRTIGTQKMKLKTGSEIGKNYFRTEKGYFLSTGIGMDAFNPEYLWINQGESETGFEWQGIELKGDDHVTFSDNDLQPYSAENGVIGDDYDEIEIRNGEFSFGNIFGKDTDHSITISDITDNNIFSANQISMTDCRTEGITIDLTDMGNQKTEFKDGRTNYCVRQLPKTGAWIKSGVQALAVAGCIVGAFFTSGWTLTFITAGLGLTEAGTQALGDYKASWPSPDIIPWLN